MDEVEIQIARVAVYFEGQQGRENYARLVHFATGQVTRYIWYSRRGSTMPGGMSAEDIVGELLKQVLSTGGPGDGRRKLPSDVDVGKALRMIVRSKLSSLSLSAENRASMREVELEDPDNTESIWERMLPWETTDELAADEDRAEALKRSAAFIDFVADDHLLHSMLVLIRDEGLDKPAEAVARRLDVNVNAIYTANRRLKSALRSFLAKSTPT